MREAIIKDLVFIELTTMISRSSALSTYSKNITSVCYEIMYSMLSTKILS